MVEESTFWILFGVIITALLVFDLGVFQRKVHAAAMKEAVLLSIFYIAISLIFAEGIFIWLGADKSYEFLTAWIVEKSLSVDNLFVFLTIFAYFQVDLKYQHKVLFWGILGALITRGMFIFIGVLAVNLINALIYALGAFLIYTAYKISTKEDEVVNPGENRVLKLASKYLPIKKDYVGSNFIIREKGLKYFATPLLLVLLVIESTDIMFATDSVPAVLSITRDTFIVYTSNIFAILGLRALYFVVASMMVQFDYLKYGVSVVLAFIGVKMLASGLYHISTGMSLVIVVSCLTVSVIASMVWKKEENKVEGSEHCHE